MKATSIDPSIVGADGVYRHRGPARVFVSETRRDRCDQGAGRHARRCKADDVVVLIGAGPLGTGMEETYQLTSALKFIPWGKTRPDRHRRALLGRVDRRVHRPRRAGGAGGRADRQAARRRRRRDRDRSQHAGGARQPGRGRRARAGRGRGGARCWRRGRCTRAWRRTPSCPTTRACGRRCSRRAAAPGAAASTTSTGSSR